MKVIEVEEMFECPFQYSEYYKMSEYTSGADDMCAITKEYCCLKTCELKKEGEIKIMWKKEDD